MEREDLLLKLNWFYSLEESQVELYLAQSKKFKGTYESIVFERTALVEQQHADRLAAVIRALAANPTGSGMCSPRCLAVSSVKLWPLRG